MIDVHDSCAGRFSEASSVGGVGDIRPVGRRRMGGGSHAGRFSDVMVGEQVQHKRFFTFGEAVQQRTCGYAAGVEGLWRGEATSGGVDDLNTCFVQTAVREMQMSVNDFEDPVAVGK